MGQPQERHVHDVTGNLTHFLSGRSVFRRIHGIDGVQVFFQSSLVSNEDIVEPPVAILGTEPNRVNPHEVTAEEGDVVFVLIGEVLGVLAQPPDKRTVDLQVGTAFGKDLFNGGRHKTSSVECGSYHTI